MAKVVRSDDETFEQMLTRFRKKVDKEYKRAWTKHRYGYHEKPTVLRRKRKKMKARNRNNFRCGTSTLILSMNLETQWQREGPTNSLDR